MKKAMKIPLLCWLRIFYCTSDFHRRSGSYPEHWKIVDAKNQVIAVKSRRMNCWFVVSKYRHVFSEKALENIFWQMGKL